MSYETNSNVPGPRGSANTETLFFVAKSNNVLNCLKRPENKKIPFFVFFSGGMSVCLDGYI